MRILRPLLTLALALPALPALATAASAQSLDLTINNTGLSVGDSRFVRGVRLNFRDRNMDRVDGINATIWYPYDDARGGEVRGLALGLPTTGARRISGAGIGVFGVGTEEEFFGLGVGGLGVGTGGDAKGIFLGGLGVGAGGDVTGITFGGLGAGAGGNVKGLTVGLLGVGAGGNITGITIGGLGAGAGGDITGFTLGVLGAGAGGTLRGITVAGLGAGAPTVRGIVLSVIAAGGHDVKGGVLAPVWFRIESDDNGGDMGIVRGVTVSAFNQIKGEQFGLSLGLLNYAWELNGVQIGLINIAERSRSGIKVLPLVNW